MIDEDDTWRALTAEERDAVALADATCCERKIEHEVTHDEFGNAYVVVRLSDYGFVLIGRGLGIDGKGADDATAQDYREAMFIERGPALVRMLAMRLVEARAKNTEALIQAVVERPRRARGPG